MDKDLISVVIPVYNTEKFLRKCLDSILNQTYENLEVVIVNDCSTDSSGEIIKEYQEKDPRIVVVEHEKNRGLFRARVSGISVAKGKYIGIVDSDDHISKDFYRKLLETAKDKKADIVMAKTVHEEPDGHRYVHNSYFNLPEQAWSGKDVLNNFLEQEGLCYIWHTVWNKLYSKRIWDKALDFFKTIEDHIIMCEDVLFSSILHFYAKSFATTDYAYYYYVRHSEASTANNNNFGKFKKNITDLVKTFGLVEEFFNKNNVSEENKLHFQKWKELYSRFWHDNVNGSSLNGSSKTMLFNMIKNGLKIEELKPATRNDHYFYRIMTDWESKYETLVERMTDPKYEYISFDIFDTIILRPFLKPTDLFLTLDSLFDSLCKDSALINFSEIRVLAEQECRKMLCESEEVQLQDIYNYMGEKYRIKNSVMEKMMKAEMEAEIKFCSARKSVVNLINIAKALNKKVICTSDFYIGKDFLTQMLNKVGVTVDEIFVSCEFGLTKHTGTLFPAVLKKLNITADKMFHIGDNWFSDYVNSEKIGIQSAFYASCKNSFMQEISDIKSTYTTTPYKKPVGMWINYERGMKFFEVRSALALCANRIYDNPYYPYNKDTLFNSDANFMGYYALGMHLWSTAKWLYNENKGKTGKVHFIARDGYLPKLAYDVINQNKDSRESSYVYVSRKSLMPLVISNKNGFLGIGNVIKLHRSTPKKLFNWFKPILNEEKIAKFKESELNEVFETDAIAYKFIENTLIDCFDAAKTAKYRKDMKAYFDTIIKKGDVSFDIGYSGRTQVLLSELLGFNLDAYFIHVNSDMNIRKQKESNIKIKSLYDYTPSITGTVREVLISELCPSCIGYDLEKGEPTFEEFKDQYAWKYALGNIQQEALNFVKDMFSTFGIRDEFEASPIDLSMPYEYLMNCATWWDTDYFFICEFEDDLWEGKYTLSDLWQRDMAYHHVMMNEGTAQQTAYIQPIAEPGVYGKLYDKLNRMFPAGSKRRKFAKKIGRIFVGKNK